MRKLLSDSKVFIISRTDSIGDVVLTIPMAGIIKTKIPDAKIIFIGNNYTSPVILLSKNIDILIKKEDLISEKINLSDFNADAIIHVSPDKSIAKLAKAAKIPFRIGTSHRWFHWIYANKRVDFSRIKSKEHEAILNLKLLKPFNLNLENITLEDVKANYGFEKNTNHNHTGKTKFIIHPKSKGSAREWSLKNYCELIKLLPKEKFDIHITGTQAEKDKIMEEFPAIYNLENVTDQCGKLTLSEFISFIQTAEILLACSTGPLHIAAAMGINALGIYSSAQNMHPRRWAALGKKVKIFYKNETCKGCANQNECACVNSISPKEIADFVIKISI